MTTLDTLIEQITIELASKYFYADRNRLQTKVRFYIQPKKEDKHIVVEVLKVDILNGSYRNNDSENGGLREYLCLRKM